MPKTPEFERGKKTIKANTGNRSVSNKKPWKHTLKSKPSKKPSKSWQQTQAVGQKNHERAPAKITENRGAEKTMKGNLINCRLTQKNHLSQVDKKMKFGQVQKTN